MLRNASFPLNKGWQGYNLAPKNDDKNKTIIFSSYHYFIQAQSLNAQGQHWMDRWHSQTSERQILVHMCVIVAIKQRLSSEL